MCCLLCVVHYALLCALFCALSNVCSALCAVYLEELITFYCILEAMIQSEVEVLKFNVDLAGTTIGFCIKHNFCI